jgi:hypothetical protein
VLHIRSPTLAQILAALPSVIPDLALPENFKNLLQFTQFLNLNLFKIARVSCIAHRFNFWKMMMGMTVLPLVLIGTLVLVGHVRASSAVDPGAYKRQFYTVALCISYVVLPGVSTVIFQAFPCDTFDNGEEVLRADYSLSCNAQR